MARSVVTVIGQGRRVIGVTKDTGKPYDFCRTAFSFIDSYGNADVAVTALSGDVLDEFDVQVGNSYEAIVNKVNRQYYIDLIGLVP